MFRVYIIKNSKLLPTEYTGGEPAVYIPYKLFLKLYSLNGETLNKVARQICNMMGTNKMCQIIPIIKRGQVYYTLSCCRPEVGFDIPVKCTKVLGGQK